MKRRPCVPWWSFRSLLPSWTLLLVTGAALSPEVAAGPPPQLGAAPGPPATALVQTLPRREIRPLGPTFPSINTASRETVRNFFRGIYRASDSFTVGWTGDRSACAPGTTDAGFQDLVALRINYYRAMSGVPATLAFSGAQHAKAQAAALMMSVNNSLSHSPPDSWSCFSTAGFEGAQSSNLGLGIVGPEAVHFYMDDFGNINTAVGHRRWLLFPQTQLMDSGDLPFLNDTNRESNALWVFDGHFFDPRPTTRDGFVAWPPPGFLPAPVVYHRWSFSYPQADFNTATVSVSSNGVALPVSIESRGAGAGENSIVWIPLGLSANSLSVWPTPPSDITYAVAVQGALVGGKPTNFSYNVTVFDPNRYGPDTVLPTPVGPAGPFVGHGNTYTFAAVPMASAYQWRRSTRTPFSDVEGGEAGLGNFNVSISAGYDALTPITGASGTVAFHLAHPKPVDQTLTFLRPLHPQTGAQLRFRSRLGFATAAQKAVVSVSVDSGVTWQTIYEQAGTAGAGETEFQSRSVPLTDFVDRALLLRFSYAIGLGGYFADTSQGVGWYLDDISLTQTDEVTDPVISSVTSGQSFSFNPPTEGSYTLDVRGLVAGSYPLEWSQFVDVDAVNPGPNTAPTLTPVSEQTIDELATLNLALAATDADIPINAFTFARVNGPDGLTVGPSGAVTWSPTETQGPFTNLVTVKVTDNGTPPLSGTNSFNVIVREVNAAPAVVAVTDQTIDELATLNLALTANDPDSPANTQTFALVSGPDGLNVSASGALTWSPTETQGPFTNLVTVKVTDNGNPPLSGTNSFNVIVREVNAAPAVVAVTDQTIDELATLNLALTANDPDSPANTHTFALVSGPGGLAVGPSGALTWSPTETQGPFTNLVTVKVTDNGTPPLSGTNSFNVIVREVNAAPAVVAVTDQTIDELATLNLALTANDPDSPANTHTFALVSGPGGLAVGPFGALTWSPTETQGPFTNLVTVKVTDNGTPPLSGTNSFNVIVREVNAAPAVVAVTDQTIDELATLNLALTANDPDSPANTHTFALVSGPDGLNVSASGALTWSPTETQGPFTNLVTVKVTDNGTPPLSGTNSFNVIVREVNAAPAVVAVTDQTIDELATLNLALTANDPDSPANTHTFALVSGPGGLNVSASGVVTWSPTETQGPFTNLVTVKATDNGTPPLSGTNSFNVIVREVNAAPAVVAVTDQTIDELATLNLALTANDPDSPANTHTFALVSGPGGLAVGPSGALTWSPTETQGPFTNLVTVKATDNGTPPLSGTNSFNVIVREVNAAPAVVAVTDQTIDELATLNLALTANDPDSPANTHTFALVSGPGGLNVSASGALTWSPTETQGPFTNLVTVKVTDNGTPPLNGTNSFNVIVREVNAAPAVVAVTDQTIDELATLNLALTANDPDSPANTHTFALVSGPGGLNVSASGALTWSPTETQGPFTNLVTVKVTDNGTPPLNGTNSFNVIVREVNAAPAVVAVTDQTIDELATLNLALTANDPDSPANTQTFALVSGPGGLNVSASGALTWSPTETQGPFTNLVTVKVTDNGTPPLSGTNSFNVIVREVNAAPAVVVVTDQTIDELATLNLALTANDPDSPANTHTFALVSGPGGLNVSASGALTWSPTETQGPFTNLVTVKVTDNGTPPLSGTNSFNVIVREVNAAPAVVVVTDQTIDELATLNLALTANDPDSPANTHTFALVSGPGGLNVSASGALTWSPTETQGPFTNLVTVKVTDNGTPPLSGTNSFNVIVREVNAAPAVVAVTDQTIDELATLNLALTANDPDSPANTHIFALVSGPGGLNVSASGALTWSPTETQGPFTNLVTVKVTDNGTPPLSGTNSFNVIVREVNAAPAVVAVTDQTIDELATLNLALTANDPDSPANTHTFALVSGPGGLNVGPSGALTWSPTETQGPFTNLVTVKVTDNGTPPLSGTNSFNVIVREVNAAPAVVAVTDQTIDELATLNLALTANDPDSPANTHTFALVSGPGGLAVGPFGALTWSPTETQGPFTNLVTVKVTDNGTPPLSGTNSFNVIVREVNAAPAVVAVTDQTIDELATLNLALTANDPDSPANTHTFALVSGPDGLNVSASGALTWSPTETQGPFTNLVTVKVTDNGTPPLSGTNSFNVIVREVNAAPAVVAVTDQTIDELATLNLALTANDPDSPANTHTFALVSGPGGLNVSASGVVTWSPTETQGPFTNLVTVKATDNGTPPLSGTNSFNVIVREVNAAPAVVAVTDQTIDELATLNLALTANDPDSPANTHIFALVSGPGGLAVGPSGAVTWSPTETQGPFTNLVTVKVTDNGTPPLSGTNSFNVIVREVNTRPSLDFIADQVVVADETLTLMFTASDTDLPANSLSFAFVGEATSGATLDPASGRFVWTPSLVQTGSHTIEVVVRDDGTPSMDSRQLFRVQVTDGAALPAVDGVVEGAVFRLGWTSITGRQYQVQFKDDLSALSWTDFGPPLTASGPRSNVSDSLKAEGGRLYRVVLIQ